MKDPIELIDELRPTNTMVKCFYDEYTIYIETLDLQVFKPAGYKLVVVPISVNGDKSMNIVQQLRLFATDITDYDLDNHTKPDFDDIHISVGPHSISIPNNADTLTKLIVYLQSIEEDVI